uniref:Uncharacterized protein n=1 Tax=Amazona collaria TaxID=241587 RepID=A0A8B9GAI5_9PSIT
KHFCCAVPAEGTTDLPGGTRVLHHSKISTALLPSSWGRRGPGWLSGPCNGDSTTSLSEVLA